VLIVIFETHSTSLDNEAGIASGHFDVALSDLGRTQAGEIAERYRDVPIDAVFCSDLSRAIETARLAFGARAIPIITDPRLRECDYGAWTRRPAVDIHAEQLQRIDEPFPGGESYRHAVGRVKQWLDDARSARPHGVIVAIAHRATWYAFEHLLAGRPLEEIVAAPWTWQPGWTYRVGEPTERAAGTRTPRG
jgi:2,3-bisphosphoglycerate-dependent phosphoglycerate mutase